MEQLAEYAEEEDRDGYVSMAEDSWFVNPNVPGNVGQLQV